MRWPVALALDHQSTFLSVPLTVTATAYLLHCAFRLLPPHAARTPTPRFLGAASSLAPPCTSTQPDPPFMAAYEISKHFSGLRVQTARRKGRPDPFATGFEDDSDDDFRKSRPKTKAPVPAKPSPIAPRVSSPTKSPPVAAKPQNLDDDDNFLLEVSAQKKADRRPSPAPPNPKTAAQRLVDRSGRRGSLPGALPSNTKKAAVLAAGPLAYLDDSDEEDNISYPSNRTARQQSPAPRKTSEDGIGRSATPSGHRTSQPSVDRSIVVPRHTVASPFAGTVSIYCHHVITSKPSR